MLGCCCVNDDDDILVESAINPLTEAAPCTIDLPIVEAQYSPKHDADPRLRDDEPQHEPEVGREGSPGHRAPRVVSEGPKPEPESEPVAQPRLESQAPEEKNAGAQSFDIAVERGGAALGLIVDVLAEGCPLYVTKIVQGCLSDYNRGVPRDRQVLEFDFITAVNGSTDRARMLKEVKTSSGYLKLRIMRPVPFFVTVKRGQAPLGASVSFQQQSSSLILWSIGDGALRQHNDRAPPEQRIFDHDCILQVNDIKGKAEMLLEEMKSAETLTLMLVRPPREASEASSPAMLV